MDRHYSVNTSMQSTPCTQNNVIYASDTKIAAYFFQKSTCLTSACHKKCHTECHLSHNFSQTISHIIFVHKGIYDSEYTAVLSLCIVKMSTLLFNFSLSSKPRNQGNRSPRKPGTRGSNNSELFGLKENLQIWGLLVDKLIKNSS